MAGQQQALLTDKPQLLDHREAWSTNNTFSHTVLVIRLTDGSVLRATTKSRVTTEIPEDLEGVETIPLDRLSGPWSEELSVASHPCSEHVYVKAPNFIDYAVSCDDTKADLGRSMVREARIWERIRAAGSHPHLAQYLGCYRDGNKVMGLCFKRYAMTLAEMTMKDARVDAIEVIKEIEGAVHFLHDNGIYHFDINPTNIMFDDEGKAVLIDLDSAYVDDEEEPIKGGTFGWSVDPEIKHCKALAGIAADHIAIANVAKTLDGLLLEKAL